MCILGQLQPRVLPCTDVATTLFYHDWSVSSAVGEWKAIGLYAVRVGNVICRRVKEEYVPEYLVNVHL